MLKHVFLKNSIHTWWSISSCTEKVSGLKEFISKEGDRVLLDIYSYRGVKISQYSVYPNESEVILLPGTVLKVIAQLDVGHGLTVIQMKEIPSIVEIKDALLHDVDAINFWTTIARDKFEIPLEDFCQAVMRKMGLPVVKNKTNELSYLQIEAYQKYWSLWLFSGGDMHLLTEYTNNNNTQNNTSSDSMLTLQRFGLLLTWFGHFSTFLNELFNACQRGIIYDDSSSNATVVPLLKSLSLSDNLECKDLWLIRCSPKRETPFVISYAKPSSENNIIDKVIAHQRILFNATTRQYLFQNILTKTVFTSDSINFLTDIIQREYKYGDGIKNSKLSIIINIENLNFNNYVETL